MQTILSIFVLLLVWVHPPFLFSAWLPFEVRLIVGACVVLTFFAFNGFVLTRPELITLGLASGCFCAEIILQKSELRNVLSFYSSLGCYILLIRYFRLNPVNGRRFAKAWTRLGYWVCISSISLFLLHQLTPIDADILGFANLPREAGYNYRFSVLGATMAKDFGSMSVVRVCSFFVEPVYAGYFFLLNVLLSNWLENEDKPKWWLALNIVAGLLTFSLSFLVGCVVYGMYSSTFIRKAGVIKMICVGVGAYALAYFVLFSGVEEIQNTSFQDRTYRLNGGLQIIRDASVSSLIFGQGVDFSGEMERGIAAGGLALIVERGVIIFLMVVVLTVNALKRDLVKCLVVFLYFGTLPVQGMFFSWVALSVFWTSFRDRRRVCTRTS